MMSAYVLKPPKKPMRSRWIGPTCAGRVCLRPRWMTTLARPVPAARLAGAAAAAGFIPADDLSQTQVISILAPGSTFQQSLETGSARVIVQKNPP